MRACSQWTSEAVLMLTAKARWLGEAMLATASCLKVFSLAPHVMEVSFSADMVNLGSCSCLKGLCRLWMKLRVCYTAKYCQPGTRCPLSVCRSPKTASTCSLAAMWASTDTIASLHMRLLACWTSFCWTVRRQTVSVVQGRWQGKSALPLLGYLYILKTD